MQSQWPNKPGSHIASEADNSYQEADATGRNITTLGIRERPPYKYMAAFRRYDTVMVIVPFR